jgi:hypothetical protein
MTIRQPKRTRHSVAATAIAVSVGHGRPTIIAGARIDASFAPRDAIISIARGVARRSASLSLLETARRLAAILLGRKTR